jgi:hypothetical protein
MERSLGLAFRFGFKFSVEGSGSSYIHFNALTQTKQ